MSNINLIYCLFAFITVSFAVRDKLPIKVLVKRRGTNLDGSLYIPNNQGQLTEYSVIFSITSVVEFWVFSSNLKGTLLDSPEFTHQFCDKTGGNIKKNRGGKPFYTFKSVAYDGTGNLVSVLSGRVGLNGFELITFQNDIKSGTLQHTAIGIVDNVMSAASNYPDSSDESGVYFDYDGSFGLWPVNPRRSYLNMLPKKMFSLYLSGSGESGELVLDGYDTSKINGDIGCQQISRLSHNPGEEVAILHFSTSFYVGKKQQTMDKKRRRPITIAVIHPELVGLLAPPLTVQYIVQKSGAKYMTVLPTINEEEEKQLTNEEDQGYFIPCRHRSAVSHLSFFLGEKLWSITGDDLFIPSPVNPSWCKMIVDTISSPEDPAIVLGGELFFKKFVTIFDFEGSGDEPKMCIGTAKHRRGKRDRVKKKALLLSDGGGSTTNMTVF